MNASSFRRIAGERNSAMAKRYELAIEVWGAASAERTAGMLFSISWAGLSAVTGAVSQSRQP